MAKQIKRVDLLKQDHVEILVKSTEVLKGAMGGTVEVKLTKDIVSVPAHKDLVDAFVRMIPHLMFGCRLAKPEVFSKDWFEDWVFLNDPRFEGISVTGVVVVGKEQMDGVKIIGRITHPNGDVVNLITPIIWFDVNSEFKYALLSYLEDHVMMLFEEADKYYFKKKYAVPTEETVDAK